MVMRSPAETTKRVNQVAPQDINGAAQGGNYNFSSLRNYQGAYFVLKVGAHAGIAVAATIQQAVNVEGSSNKAISFDKYYSNDHSSANPDEVDLWQETTGAAGTFNITAQTNYVIPIKPAELDVTNRFDCIRGHLSEPAAACMVSLELVLYGGPEGIVNDKDHIPSAAVNRQDN